MNELKKGILDFFTNKEIDLQPFINSFEQKRQLKKNDYLIQPGINSNFLALILKGSFRIYFINENGDEITTWFGFPNMWVTDLYSYYKEQKAVYYVRAMEDCEVAIIKKKNLKKIYKSNPEYLEFAKKFAEYGMIMMMERCDNFQALTAKERYLNLLKTPIIKHNIPYKYIASFLGITETSLSRIKKSL